LRATRSGSTVLEVLRGLVLILPVLAALWVERAIRRWRPLWLVPFAFVPMGRSRRVELAPSVAAAAREQAERPYRRSAAGEPEASRLPLPRHTERGDARIESTGDVAAVSSPYHYAVARIDVRIRDEVATLRARCLPVPLSILGWSALVLLASRGSLFMTVLALGVPVVVGIASYARIRPHVDEAMDDLAARLGGNA
jgi:hypothetical protein